MAERVGKDLKNAPLFTIPRRIAEQPAATSTGDVLRSLQTGSPNSEAFAAVLAQIMQGSLDGLSGQQGVEPGDMAGGAFGDTPLAALAALSGTAFGGSSSPTLEALLGTDPRLIPWPSQRGEGTGGAGNWGERIGLSVNPPVSPLHPLTRAPMPRWPPVRFPRPAGDNGRGMHWIPTLSQTPEVVDRFVRELQEMKIKWAVILNDGTDAGRNDYLVERLTQAGIMPVMRIYTPGLQPIPPGELEKLVRHYRDMGVYYYQIYNEPNLRFENGGRDPDVNRYLDLWIPAARAVARAGGLPGFGALSPGGDVNDLQFLQAALQELKRRGQVDILNRAWLSVHNYDLGDSKGFFRYRRYADAFWNEVGHLIPMIGTEGGTYSGGDLTVQDQVERVCQSYAYMAHREPYFLAYSYWIIANEAGGGHDRAFSHQALFRPDGVSPIVNALKEL